MRLVPLLALVSLGALSAAAQTAPSTAAGGRQAKKIVVLQASPQGCPIGFEARRARDGGLVNVRHSSKPYEQAYSLTFSPAFGHRITQASITLHGLAGAHVIPAKNSAAPDATESFNVSPSASSAKPLFQSTVYTQKLTGVQWVELNELTYADGTQWHESSEAICRVAPNGFMLVGSAK